VLGDDLALNAEQVAGVTPDRELPVVWAVAKGSAINKVILVPAALLISAFLPQLITPLLLIGGLFLCFEGFEKVAHKLLHSKKEEDDPPPRPDQGSGRPRGRHGGLREATRSKARCAPTSSCRPRSW
jgi:predicted DNA repair protein MutK